LFSAYYSTGVWTLVGLLLVIAAAMGTVARPPRITLPVSLLVLGVTGLGLWSLLSTTWAQAAEQAVVDGNLWLAYTALVLLTLVLIARRGHAVTLLACVGIGIGVVAASVLVRLLGTDPGTLFVGARLNFPLGYINGEGCVFAMGVWPALALAERRHPVVAATGVGASVVMASLALLSQSRGAAIATGITILLALFVIPGWRRRALAMAVIVGGFAAAASSVAHIYAVGKTGAVITTAAHHAGLAIAVAAFAAGLVWGVGVALANKVSLREGRLAVFAERVATVLAVVVIAAPLTAAAVSAPQLVRTARQQWYAFMHLGANEGAGGGVNSSQTRLFSGGGNRYDYWRVAWKVFKGHPVLGVGAGNYPAYYFRYRRTVESIENPHSLELQTAAELGVVGAAFLLLVFAGLGIGLVRQRSHARRSPAARGVMVAATGVSVVWLIDASGDWMHLLPGVAAIGLLALAALCRSSDVEISRDCGVAERSVPRLPALLGAATAIFILAVAGASLLRAALGQHYLDEAHAALHSHPATAIAVAQKALRLDGANLDAYYIMAAGQARFDRASAARSTLLAATRKDPQNFVTWALLGDLEVRAGDATAARAYYRRALSLDPREPTLKTLVTEPVRKLLRAAG
jgi:tetratricopeptide (TPR) repeat protein